MRSMEAIRSFGDSSNIEDYVFLKIKPHGIHCCCLSHCHEAWEEINNFIRPFGPLGKSGRNEDFVVLELDKEKYFLETHETGPEILLYIGASIGLIKAVVELITTISKAFKKENKGQSFSYKVNMKYGLNGQIIEKEIECTSSDKKALEELILSGIEDGKSNRNKGNVPPKKH